MVTQKITDRDRVRASQITKNVSIIDSVTDCRKNIKLNEGKWNKSKIKLLLYVL